MTTIQARGLVLVLGAAALMVSGCSKPEPAAEPVRAVKTLVLQPVAVRPQAEYAAEIRARTESRLGFRVPGKLVDRPAQIGQVVRKGQLLARLDPQELQLSAQAAQAGVRALDVQAAQSEADLKRFQDLHAQGFIGAAELERRRAATQAAQAQRDQARAQSEVQGRQLSHGSLLADASGVITAVEAEPGTVLAAGQPVVRLAWDGPRDVVFAIPEDRVQGAKAQLGVKGALAVRLWGDQPEALTATIREIAAAADPVTRTFQIKAELQDRPSVKIGQTATVSLSVAPPQAALRLPLTALLQQQGQTQVWLLDAASMTVRLQPVQIAGADGNEALVAAGLQPGQEVVSAGVHVLTAGQPVKRYGTAAPAEGAASAARRTTP